MSEIVTKIPAPFSVDSIKHGVTTRVLSVNRLMVQLELGFGVFLAHTFVIDGVIPARIPKKHRTQALHCIVVLLGGKRVIVQPENDKPTCTFARVFLNEKIHGSPLGLVTNVDRLDRPILDVTPFFTHLAEHDFDVKFVHEVVNRNVSKETP